MFHDHSTEASKKCKAELEEEIKPHALMIILKQLAYFSSNNWIFKDGNGNYAN